MRYIHGSKILLLYYRGYEKTNLNISVWLNQIQLDELLCVFRIETNIENSPIIFECDHHIAVALQTN